MHPKAKDSRNFTQCDSLLIGDKCGAHTVPYIEVKNKNILFCIGMFYWSHSFFWLDVYTSLDFRFWEILDKKTIQCLGMSAQRKHLIF